MVVSRIQILQLREQSVSFMSQVVKQVLQLGNLVLILFDVVLKRQNLRLQRFSLFLVPELAVFDLLHRCDFRVQSLAHVLRVEHVAFTLILQEVELAHCVLPSVVILIKLVLNLSVLVFLCH